MPSLTPVAQEEEMAAVVTERWEESAATSSLLPSQPEMKYSVWAPPYSNYNIDFVVLTLNDLCNS